MRKSTRYLFKERSEFIKQLKTRKERDKAITDLTEIMHTYDIAVDFEYPEEVLVKIRAAKTPIQAQNILIAARRAS